MKVGTAYDIPGCTSQPGVAPRRGVVVVAVVVVVVVVLADRSTQGENHACHR